MEYYICCLKSGATLNFDKQCTNINWENGVFSVKDCKGKSLGVIPVENVEYFIAEKR
nr:MAG TPA: hypothetical protein [Caudoviricetes sp.]